jgi:hypothetical protein
VACSLAFELHSPRIMMLRRLLSAVALLLLLTSRADAATINLLLTVDINSPTSGPLDVGFSYEFFTSATGTWPGTPLPRPPALATGGGSLSPGVTQFPISLNTESLDNFYFIAYGEYTAFGGAPPIRFPSFYVAGPPEGLSQDELVGLYGPPWIALESLSPEGLTGGFDLIFGFNRPGGIGTWTVTAAADPAPVPEPTTLLLFGSGLAAIAAKKYRRSNVR